MPFFSMNPQGLRLTPVPSASNSAAATTTGSSQFNNLIDTATIQNLPGAVAWYKDGQGQVSVLAYAIAHASITYGQCLQHQAGGATTATMVGSVIVKGGFDNNVVSPATTGIGGYSVFAGISGASVINTGAGFWRYISGFVPEAQIASSINSGHLLIVGASAAGILASMGSLGTFGGSTQIPVAICLGLTGANGGSVNSVYLTGWYY